MNLNETLYEWWCCAICDWLLSSCRSGEQLYLDIRPSTISRVAEYAALVGRPSPGAVDLSVESFYATAKDWIAPGGRVLVWRQGGSISDPHRSGRAVPNTAVFLGLLVHAAYEMGSDASEGVFQTEFWQHFSNLLGLHCDEGRPPGLEIDPVAPEDYLWLQWNQWVKLMDRVDSAVSGQGAYRYTGYAISQCLLRHGDAAAVVEAARVATREGRLPRGVDESRFSNWFVASPYRFAARAHLSRLLADRRPARLISLGRAGFDAFLDAADSFPMPDHHLEGAGVIVQANANHHGRCFRVLLTREVDYATGEQLWQGFARIPGGLDSMTAPVATLCDSHDDFELKFIAGCWIGPFPILNLNTVTRWIVRFASGVEVHAEFSPRPMWILTERGPGGMSGPWRAPTLGELFTLVASDDADVYIGQLKSRGLIASDSPKSVTGFNGWVIRENVMTLAGAWDGEVALAEVAQGLIDDLRPRFRSGLSLVGGLTGAPGEWLMSAPPDIRIILLDREIVSIGLRESGTGTVVAQVECGYSCELPWSSLAASGVQPGSYEVFLRVPAASNVDFVTISIRLVTSVSVSTQPFEDIGIALGNLRAMGLEATS